MNPDNDDTIPYLPEDSVRAACAHVDVVAAVRDVLLAISAVTSGSPETRSSMQPLEQTARYGQSVRGHDARTEGAEPDQMVNGQAPAREADDEVGRGPPLQHDIEGIAVAAQVYEVARAMWLGQRLQR